MLKTRVVQLRYGDSVRVTVPDGKFWIVDKIFTQFGIGAGFDNTQHMELRILCHFVDSDLDNDSIVSAGSSTHTVYGNHELNPIISLDHGKLSSGDSFGFITNNSTFEEDEEFPVPSHGLELAISYFEFDNE